MNRCMLNWLCGLAVVIGLPLGLLVAIESGNLLAGFGSMIAVVFIGLLACREDIIRDYCEIEESRHEKSKDH